MSDEAEAKVRSPELNVIGDSLVELLSQEWGEPVAIVLFTIGADGQVDSTTNLDMMNYREFIKDIAASTKTGDYAITNAGIDTPEDGGTLQ